MKDTNTGQRHRKLPRVCKFLLMIHPKLQPHSKTTEQTKRQEGLEMGRRTSKSIQRTQRKDNKLTSTSAIQKRRKIQSRNGHIRIHYKRSTIPGTRQKMETNSILIKDNAISRKKQNLQQRVTSNSRGSSQVETVFIRYSRNIQNLNVSQKFEVLPRTSQAKQKTSKMVFEAARL